MKDLLKYLYEGIIMIFFCSIPVIALVGAILMFIEMLSATGLLAVLCFCLSMLFAFLAIVIIIGIGAIVDEPVNKMQNEEETQ